MILFRYLLDQKRAILFFVSALSLMGVYTWFAMPRQEDPAMREYWANIVARMPGADAETIERLLLEPLEEYLAEVEELVEFNGTAIQEVALIDLELNNAVSDTEAAWDEVRKAIVKAELEFPAGVLPVVLDTDLNDQDAVVLAVTGSDDLLVLLQAARKIKKQLLALNQVAKVNLVGDPHEQIIITYDEAQAFRLGIDPVSLAAQLRERNRNLAGGSVQLSGRNLSLNPQTEFRTIEEIQAQPILLPSGTTIPLKDIAQVHHGPKTPAESMMHFNGQNAVGLGIVPKDGVHFGSFGKAVLAHLETLSPEYAPLNIHLVEYLPNRVQARLDNLGQSLLLGIGVVCLVLLVSMGLRMGLVVSVIVPLVTFISLGVFASAGGVLHQISIAAFIIALGMLVDNAIVIVENVQWCLDQGMTRREATLTSVKTLAIPLASATGTTLAAFLPMLLAGGLTAEFTRAVPIVLMLTLTMSYLCAIFVSPILSEIFLRPRIHAQQAKESRFNRRIADWSTRFSPLVLLLAVGLIALSLMGARALNFQFFPESDRNQFVVEVRLPEGAHLGETDRVIRELETHLQDHSRVTATASFMGRSAPHFYYNLSQIPFSPHFAQMLIQTKSPADLAELIAEVDRFAAEFLPEADVIPRKLEQGPPVKAPVEIRLFGNDLEALHGAADLVLAELAAIEGTQNARHDMSLGAPALKMEIDDAAAARLGLQRSDIATMLYGRTRGLNLGEFRAGEDPVPVILRSSAGELMPVHQLKTLSLKGSSQNAVPLDQVVTFGLEWRPMAIEHRNRSRLVTVSSQLAQGMTFNQVQGQLETRLEHVALPPGVRLEFGGQAEGSAEANAAMVLVLPWGIVFLFGILLLEFNSFRRALIVLISVPLAAIGIVPGLLLSGQPFGFMSLLGVIALAGVVVNNAIVLLDLVEAGRARGLTKVLAVREAVQRRTRPILLTTATTVAGLLPLAFSATTLWPPLAWTMISGLVASTFLTLMVVPSLYLVAIPEAATPTAVPPETTALATMHSQPLGGEG